MISYTRDVVTSLSQQAAMLEVYLMRRTT